MGYSHQLPSAYVWREDEHGHTLSLNECPIMNVAPLAAGWRVQVVLQGEGIQLQEYTVRSLARGKSWAQRWVKQRERLVAIACGRPVKPLPAISSARGIRRRAA